MKTLQLADLAQVAEVIAAAGVILSLIYVGFELAENTAAVRAGTSQAIFDSSREFVLDVALSEDLSRIRSVGKENLSDLSEAEAYRFQALVLGNWIYFQNIWIQWSLNVVDDRAWESAANIFCGQLKGPGTLQAWQKQRHLFSSEFLDFVDQRCLEH